MIMMMPISHQQAFLLSGNWYNVAWPAIRNPYDRLPPMFMDGILPQTYTISEFKVRPLTFSGVTKTVGTPETLATSLIQWTRGEQSDTFYYTGKARLSLSITQGYHELYVKLSNGDEYISEPFLYITDSCISNTPTVGDYAKTSPNDDYSEDYYK
ncbi:MAG: hypothetical protein RQ760_16525 [Sedimentisphaerales bacterium]|nr:hypothetical protein [Sedimentisphaerales bacterium]